MATSRRSYPHAVAALTVVTVAVSCLVAAGVPASAADTAQSKVVNADPADWTPQIRDGQVNAIVQLGTKVVVGGTFTTVRRAGTSQDLTRNYLFAFDMNTGAIDPNFVPQLNNSVLALTPGPDGTSVFVGGLFNTVNGATFRNLVRLRLSDGQAVSGFKANTDARVQDLELNHGWLYVSGKFTKIKGLIRSGLARIDPTTGDVDANLDLPFANPLRGTMGVPEIDVSPDGTKLIAIGSFGTVAGLTRVQIAVLDVGVTPARVSSWQTDDYPVFIPGSTTTWCGSAFETYMRSAKISPDNQYFIVATTGGYRAGRLCDTATRWDLNATGAGQHPAWVDWSGGDTTWSVGASGTAIYVGGHFRWWNNPYRGDAAGPGAVAREGIAALDPLTGLPFSWNPGHERGVGIFTLPATPDGVWAGSDTDHTGGEFHQKIAFYPLAGGVAPPPIVVGSLPGDLYTMDAASGALSRRSFDGSTLGSPSSVPGVDWTAARGAFVLSGRVYYGLSDGTFDSRTFDGTNLGPQTQINLNGLDVQPPTNFTIPGTSTRVPAFTTDLAAMTGMFYDNGRIYYTVSKSGTQSSTTNNMLFYRYFNPESGIVGANLFVASTYPSDNVVPWANVRGLTLASGRLIYALTDGKLYTVGWNGSKPTGAPTQIGTATTWQSRGMFVYNPTPPDTTAPTTPGTPTGSSISAGVIRISWAPSSDASAVTYRIYRDGGSTPIAQSTSTRFTDTGLTVGSTHTYRVDAVDASNNASALSGVSDAITVTPAIFVDDFASGNFTEWTSATGLTVDTGAGSPAPPSARAQVTSTAAYANQDFEFTYASACASTNVNVRSTGGNSVDLFRLRTPAGGPIAKVFVTSAGTLVARSDFASTQQTSGVAIGSGWHQVELCGTVGAGGSWDLYRDGVKIVNGWVADTGPGPIGRIQLGDTGAKTYDISYDHVRVDVEPGEPFVPDTTPPTVPGKPTGTSPTTTSIALSWTGSQDESLPITYRIYRDGGSTAIASTANTTYTDTGLESGSTHTYRVDAVDAADNASAPSGSSDPIVVTIFADDFSSGDFSNWTGVARLSIDQNAGGAAPPSALGSPSAQSAFATKDLPTAYAGGCLSLNVNAASLGGVAVDLFRFRNSAGGPIAKVFVNSSGALVVRSDVTATQKGSGVALGAGWHNVEACGSVGSASTWDLYRDGVRIVTGWVADTGTQPIARIQMGDTASGKTWTMRFDDVRFDQSAG